MQYLLITIASLIGLVFYQFSKRKQAETDSLIANTKGQDAQLEKQEINVKTEIKEIDARLNEIKKQREESIKIQDNMSLAERAEDSNKKFGGK